MSFVHRDQAVQTVASHRANNPFANRIGHGRPHGRFEHAQPQIPDTLIHLFGENGIPVMDQDAVRVTGRNRFSELLHGPLGGGMRRHIDVKESAARMLNDHKHVENAKRRRDHHAEVTCHNAFGLVADERGPALRGTAVAWTSHAVAWRIFVHGSRRDSQTKLQQQFVGNALLAPCWIVLRHLADKRLQLRRNAWPSRARFPAPEQPEPLAMPAGTGLWGDYR